MFRTNPSSNVSFAKQWLSAFSSGRHPRASRRNVESQQRLRGEFSLQAEAVEARTLLSASNALWDSIESVPAVDDGDTFLRTDVFEAYSLDTTQVRNSLAAAPLEFSDASAGLEFSIPNPDGDLERFLIFESPVMAPELAAQFPEIRTYAGQGIDDPAATLRFDITPAGFHAQVLSPHGSWYVDPYYHLNDDFYASYFTSDADGSGIEFHEEEDHDHDHDHNESRSGSDDGSSSDTNDDFARNGDDNQSRSGQQLRTYQIAVAATGEYTQFHGGTVALGQAAVVTAINRVTGIYENELSIRLQLVGNNSTIVYTDAATDPYTNNNAGSLLVENQTNLDNLIGDNNYDIGHVFSTGAGGLAGLGVAGRTGVKARGATGLTFPIGDPFYVDYVAHEVGHQFGGNHTFNGVDGFCNNRNGSTAYEPGGGSTIQAYAGICRTDDLQPNSDPYFHSVSFDEIIRHVDTRIPNEGTRITTGNNVPDVSAGANYTIPAQTPFLLTASGSDADTSDVLTYNWEQRDLGPQQSVNDGDNGFSPLFRSFTPTTDPTRTIPRLDTLLANTTIVGETLPTTNRTLNFRATVRDNSSLGGGVNTDDMFINVINTGTGFAVTSPNTAVTYVSGSTQAVTWDVAGTTANGIDTSDVNILFSMDGGLTFPITLAAAVPNDGSQDVVIPNIGTDLARIKVEAVGNIFFDVSNANFRVISPDLNVVALDATQFEGDSGTTGFTFEVTRTGDLNVTTTANYVVTGAGSNPTDGEDFGGEFPSGSVSFDMGETAKAISVSVNADRVIEADEEFKIALTDVVGGTFVGSEVGVILNDDVDSITLSFADAEISEGDGAAATTATITRTGDMTESLVVDLVNSDSSEIRLPNRFTLDPDQDSVTFTVDAIEDFELDGTQTVTVTISAPGMLDHSAAIDVRDNEAGHFGRLLPLGSLVSAGQSTASLLDASDHYDFELFLDAGETLAAVLTPQGPAQLTAELLTVSGTYSSPGDGAPAIMGPQAITTAGWYTLRITGNAASSFDLQLLRNTAIEAMVGDTSDSIELAIDDSALGLNLGRYAVTGAAVLAPADRPPFFNRYNDASAFLDISETGNSLALDEDGVTAITTTVGNSIFPSGNVDVSNNGGIIADAGASLDFLNTSLPSSDFTNALLPFWDDLAATSGDVFWEERQVDGIDTLIVQWNRPHVDSPNVGSFQLQLFGSGPGLLRYAYSDVSFGDTNFDFGNSATIGVQTGPLTADQFSFNQPVIFNGDVIEFRIPEEDVDEYEVDLTGKAGNAVDIALAGNRGADFTAQSLQLLDVDGVTVLATGVVDPLLAGTAVTNFDLGIAGFVVPADGIYTLRLTSDVAGEYTAVITDSAAFDAEPNGVTAPSVISTSQSVLGWVDATTDQTDSYLIDLVAGATITLGTETPFDTASGEPSNSLDPEIQIIHPDGSTVLAKDTNSAFDGRNAGMWFTVTETGRYQIAVTATAGAGEYIVRVSDGVDVSASLSAVGDGDESGADALYTVSLSHSNATAMPVVFDLVDLDTGTAAAGFDYTPVPVGAQLIVGHGTNSASYSVLVIDDTNLETTESVVLQISESGGSGVSVADATAKVLILDDDTATAAVSIVSNGTEDGTGTVVVIVSLSSVNATGSDIRFDVVDLMSGTATTGLDYADIPPDAQVTISAGATQGTYSIPVVDDALFETPVETLTVAISNPSHPAVSISSSSATAGILDNDRTRFELEVTQEGAESGPSNIVVTLTLDKVNDTDSPLVFTFSDLNQGSATADVDYVRIAADAEIVVPIGASSAIYTVEVFDDALLESTEDIGLAASPANDPRIEQGSPFLSAAIADDESANANLSLISDGREAGPVNVVFTVTLTQANRTGKPITFDVDDLFTGSAVAGADYESIATDAKLVVPAGAVAGSFAVNVIDDLRLELDETLNIRVSNPSDDSVTLGTSVASATIFSNDIASASLSKDRDGSESGSNDVIYKVTLNHVNETGSPVVFDLADSGLGTATAGDDYVSIPVDATISVPNGQLVGTYRLTPIDDSKLESPETVTAEISSPSSNLVTLATASATAEIFDNDRAVGIVRSSQIGNEDGSASLVFTLTLDKVNETDGPVKYQANSPGGTATIDLDYSFLPSNAFLTVPIGSSVATLSIPILDDSLVEPVETLQLSFTDVSDSSVAVSLTPPLATGLILSDDLASISVSETSTNTLVTEAGSTDSFNVVLPAQPLSDVVLDIQSLDESEVTVDKTSLTFTSLNWHVPQVVTVTGVDDFDPDGTQTTPVSIAVDTVNSDSLFALSGGSVVGVQTTDDEQGRLDVDANGTPNATTDGILILRHLFAFTGEALIQNALGAGAGNTTAEQVISALNESPEMLDVDGNGIAGPTTDGILIVRYLFQFRGDALIRDAVGDDAVRTSAADITNFLDGFMPAIGGRSGSGSAGSDGSENSGARSSAGSMDGNSDFNVDFTETSDNSLVISWPPVAGANLFRIRIEYSLDGGEARTYETSDSQLSNVQLPSGGYRVWVDAISADNGTVLATGSADFDIAQSDDESTSELTSLQFAIARNQGSLKTFDQPKPDSERNVDAEQQPREIPETETAVDTQSPSQSVGHAETSVDDLMDRWMASGDWIE